MKQINLLVSASSRVKMNRFFLMMMFLFFNLAYINAQVNWTFSNNGLPSTFAVNSFTVQNNTVYALGSYYNGSSFVGRLYKTTNSGANWTEVSMVVKTNKFKTI